MTILSLKETRDIFLSAFPKSKLQILELRPNFLRVKKPQTSEKDLRPGNSVSGPAMMEFVDIAMFIAMIAHLGEAGFKSVTSNFHINFLRRVQPGELIAEVTMLKIGKRLSVGDVLLFSVGEEQPVAHAVLTYMPVYGAG